MLIFPDAGIVDNISKARFITDFDTDFPESLDGDMFPIFIMAIDGQEDVSDQSCQHLDHQSVFAP